MGRIDIAIPQLFPFQRILTKEQQEVLDIVRAQFDTTLRQFQRIADEINGGLTFGHPRDEFGNPFIDNIQVSWHTEILNGPEDLAVVKTITHNFDIPAFSATSPGDVVFFPNVFWIPVRWQRGDMVLATSTTVSNNPPTPLVHGQPIGTIYRESGDNVASNNLELRFDISHEPTSAAPVNVDFMLLPAVR